MIQFSPFTSKKWGYPVGTIFDLYIYIHVSFFVLVFLDFLNSFRYDDAILWIILFGILDLTLLVGAFLHELGHVFGAQLIKAPIDYILLWPFGSLVYIGRTGNWRHNIGIAVAGSLTHVPLIVISATILSASGDSVAMSYHEDIREYFGENLMRGIFLQQLLLAVLNLVLPFYPFDGGRIFASLGARSFDPTASGHVIAFSSFLVGVGFIVWGAVSSLLYILLIGLWLLYHARVVHEATTSHRLFSLPLYTLGDSDGVQSCLEENEHLITSSYLPPSNPSPTDLPPSGSLPDIPQSLDKVHDEEAGRPGDVSPERNAKAPESAGVSTDGL
eukprot:Rmarinus@m.22652